MMRVRRAAFGHYNIADILIVMNIRRTETFINKSVRDIKKKQKNIKHSSKIAVTIILRWNFDNGSMEHTVDGTQGRIGIHFRFRKIMRTGPRCMTIICVSSITGSPMMGTE